MGPPEGVCRGRVGDKELIEDEGVEVWDNRAEESFGGGGIDKLTL